MDSRRELEPLKDMLPFLWVQSVCYALSIGDSDYDNLPSVGGTTSGVGLAADVRVLVLVAEVKAEVVDDEASVFNHIGALLKVKSGSITANILETSHVIGVGRGGKAREDTLLGQEESSGADGKDSPLAGWVLLLQLGKVADEGKGLVLFLKDLGAVAAKNKKHVKFLETFVSLLVGNLRANDDALLGQDLGLGTGGGDLESLGG